MRRRYRYGYKVCYREEGKTRFVRHFLAYTKKQAASMIEMYIRYPETAHRGKVLKNPEWKIIPVSRSEVIAGIWRECPF
jgi:hypothetical protein